MAASSRVVFDPVLTRLPGRQPFVERGTLRLSQLGAGATRATLSPQPARLDFFLAYIEKVRGTSPEFSPLASITGQIKLGAQRGPAVFVFGPEASIESQRADTQEPPLPPRIVILDFSGDTFENAPQGAAARLLLPEPEAKGVRFAEIGVALSIAGGEEAGMDK